MYITMTNYAECNESLNNLYESKFQKASRIIHWRKLAAAMNVIHKCIGDVITVYCRFGIVNIRTTVMINHEINSTKNHADDQVIVWWVIFEWVHTVCSLSKTKQKVFSLKMQHTWCASGPLHLYLIFTFHRFPKLTAIK